MAYYILYLQSSVDSFAAVSMICAIPPAANQSCYQILNNVGFDNVFGIYIQVSTYTICILVLCGQTTFFLVLGLNTKGKKQSGHARLCIYIVCCQSLKV